MWLKNVLNVCNMCGIGPIYEVAMNKDPSLFAAIPTSDQLNFLSDPAKAIKFLDLSKSDVASSVGLSPSSIRYDDKMPKKLKEYALHLAGLVALISENLDWNEQKTMLWFSLPNPALGGITPLDMIKLGELEKLRQIIIAKREGNTP